MAARRTRATTKAAKPEPEVVEEELEELEEDLEETEEDEDEAPAKKKAAKKKAEAPVHGTSWLVDHVNETLGTEYKAYDLRIVLRKMSRAGDFDREVGEDRSRYTFSGAKDPVVVALLKKLKSGELEKERKEKLAALKEKKASTKAKKKAEADDDEDEVEDLDFEDEDDE